MEECQTMPIHMHSSLVPDPSSNVKINLKIGGGRIWANGLPFGVTYECHLIPALVERHTCT